MSEASTVEPQTNTSPARQMLAALTQASKDMTTKFNEVSERANKLNLLLDGDVNRCLADINQQAESIVRLHLEGLAAEKDAVLAELTVLRQEELKVLQNIAKNLREALNEKLNELVSELHSEIKEQLNAFRENIGQKESELAQIEKNLRKILDEKLPLQLSEVRSKIEADRKDLESLQFRQQGQLAQESKQFIEKLHEHGSALKNKLVKEQSEYLEAIEESVKEVLQVQAANLEKRLQEFSSMQEKAKPQLEVDISFLEKVPPSFAENCRQINEMKLEIHQAAVKNLSLVYSAEINALAREIEDNVVVVRSHILSQLRSYHDHYIEQAGVLLNQFEKNARGAKPVPAAADKPAEEEEVPVELFDKLRKDIRKITKDIVSAAENEMEQTFADFRLRVVNGSQAACSLVENSFNDCRKKLIEASEAHQADLEELSHKGDALEQLVEEAKELIGALNPSNLEF